MRFTSFALNKKIKDDPEILAMVDNALDKCAKLDKSKNLIIKILTIITTIQKSTEKNN